MSVESNLKIKNENPQGASIRVQSWNGKVPTYDNDLQRGQAVAAAAYDVDSNPLAGETTVAGETATPVEVEKLPEGYAKLNKDQLIALATERKEAGKDITLEDTDTVKILRDKIEATYPEVSEDAQADASAKVEAKDKENKAELQYNFTEANLLQEKTLAVGEEKVFGINADTFITIKIDR